MDHVEEQDQFNEQLDAVVIGAGQSGLACGYHLAGTGLRFEILDAAARVGDVWRSRWDTLRLFTPAQHDGLPGFPFPAARHTFPGKEEFASYLEEYAARFQLPVRTEIRVVRASHRVLISGRPTPHIPDPLLRYAGGLYWQFIHSVLTTRTPIGRKVAANFDKRGAPLIRISAKDLLRAGVVRVPRMTGTVDGLPAFDGGTSARVRTVIWATGYRPQLGWIDGLELPASGWPTTHRGAVTGIPGLYVMGMPFQYALTSGLIGGVGRDAAYVVEQLVKQPGRSVVPAVLEARNGDGEHGGGGEAEHTGGGHAGPQRHDGGDD